LPDQVEFRFLAPNWRPMIKRSIFEATAWHGTAGAQLRRSFKILLDGLRAGRYFMLPGDHCDFCEVAVACRRFHDPSWTRVRLDGSAKVLRRLRQEKACCD
jgi:ATP-dependent helicase/nuclease subunit B